jgi:hypothetical protein
VSLASHITGLNSLAIELPNSGEQDGWVEVPTAAGASPCLQHLSVVSDPVLPLDPEHLSSLFSRCNHLVYLELRGAILSQEGLDVLLEHGTTITILKVRSIVPEESRAHWACCWRELHFTSLVTLHALAYLPLKTVLSLQLGAVRTPAVFELPVTRVHPDDICDLVRQAALNLAACPAWQNGNRSQILFMEDLAATPQWVQYFNSWQRVQLLQAVAPLGGPHITHVLFDFRGLYFPLGQAEVRALAHSLGGSVASLCFSCCTLRPCFWPAVYQHFPSLCYLRLCSGTEFETYDLAQLCHVSLRPAAVGLEADVYEQVQMDTEDNPCHWHLRPWLQRVIHEGAYISAV